jgi:hypothetical protein
MVTSGNWQQLATKLVSLYYGDLTQIDQAYCDIALRGKLYGLLPEHILTRFLFHLTFEYDWENILIVLNQLSQFNVRRGPIEVLSMIFSFAIAQNSEISQQVAKSALALGAMPDFSGLCSDNGIAVFIPLPLNVAARKKDKQLMINLLSIGADPNKREGSAFPGILPIGETPIVTLARNNAWELIPLFISTAAKKLDANSLGCALQVALYDPTAAPPGKVPPKAIIKLLLEEGANPNFRQEGGGCALHGAIKLADRDLIRLLLSYGADLTMLTADNSSVFDYAKSCGYASFQVLEEEVHRREISKAKNVYMCAMAFFGLMPELHLAKSLPLIWFRI